MTKFVASTVEVDKDIDVIAEDIKTAENVLYFVDEAINRGGKEVVYVVGEDAIVAENVAAVLNAQYEKEMELMKDANMAKEEVTEVIEAVIKQNEVKVDEDKNAAARAFLNENGAAMVNGKKTTKTKGEVKVKNIKVVGNRRRLAGTVKEEVIVNTTKVEKEVVAVKKETSVKKETPAVKKEEKGTTRRRISSGVKEVAESSRAVGRRRLGRSASIRNEFKKFEGPWYLNADLYPVLARFDAIAEDMADAELGITDIALVEPQEISRYKNRADILFVVQIKANGNVLEFPIKDAASNSSSDLSSSSIGWISTKNGMRPSFGFWRPNEINVKATCTCGNEFEANTGNMYCGKCKTRHDSASVSLTHNLDIQFDGDWVFQTVPNLVVPRDILALALAMAQFDEGLDMWGVIEE